MIGFFGFVLVVVVGIHLYLWKRLVRDTLRPGPARKVGGLVILVLAILLPANLILVRAADFKGLAWPGYLWIALMFYLLVALVVLEIPRLVISLIWRAQGKGGGDETSRPVAAAASGGTTRSSAGGGALPGAETDGPAGNDTTARGGSTGSNAGSSPDGTNASNRPDGTNASNRPDASNASSRLDASNAGSRPDGSSATGGDQIDGGASESDTTGGRPAGDATAGRDRSGSDDDNADGDGDGDDNAAGDRGIGRRMLLARGAAIFAGLTAVGVTGYGVRTALGGPQLDRVQIPLAKLPRAMDGTRLAVVSDIHLGPLTGARHMGRIVEMINSVDADVVCIVGDMVDGTVAELGRFAEPLRDIRSRQGAYFVTGNHEYYSGFQEWVDEVARLGVRPLRNERLEIVTRGGTFELAGVNDLGGEDVGDGPDFEAALGDRDKTRPVVLMAHQPIVARDAARFGVDLQVSGHTHGGQMAPFNYLVKLEQPVVSGYGEVDGVPVYVTNGAGFWGPPVRVGAPPQVTLIELKAP